MYPYLTDDFLTPYSQKKPSFTEIGEFVYYRTYSRWIESEKRREDWWETVARAVNYNVGLILKKKPDYPLHKIRREAEELYDNMYNLRLFLSGRTTYIGGTEVADKCGFSNFNCTGLVLDCFEDYSELFTLLMLGAGVGFRILPEDVAKFPSYRTNVSIEFKPYEPVPKDMRLEYTAITAHQDDKSKLTLIVGDSKEGWSQSIEYYFRILYHPMYRSIQKIEFDLNNIRPKGERLKTFGGTASGSGSMHVMLEKIHYVMKHANGKLKPIDALDISNIIGENVTSGGIRRTAQLSLFDPDDTEVLHAKSNIYTQNEEGDWVPNSQLIHRRISNNSILFRKKPSKKQLKELIHSIRITGEPGFINEKEMLRRNPNAKLTNPCFRGDMKLRTDKGDIPFSELDGKTVKIINNKGRATKSRVWKSGEREIWEIKTKTKSIYCTNDHVFLTNNGEVQAKDLLGCILYGHDGQFLVHSKINEVISVSNTKEIASVYDFCEPITHWGIVEGFVAHNCGEITLDDKQCCNLFPVNVFGYCNYRNNRYHLNKRQLYQAMTIGARASIRMTLVELDFHEWMEKQNRDRLIGVSLMGWQDMVEAMNLTHEQEEELQSILRDIVHKAGQDYAKELGINVPILMTCEKPDGTIALLPTVSSGIHWSHSPYYIRRVRINTTDPLCKVAEELGWPVYPEVGQTEENCSTKVIEFPVKSPVKRTKYDVSAIEQLENYQRFMKNYVDMNASITISVQDHEWEGVEDWLFEHWDDVVGITFMSLDNHTYALAPYEAITEEEYINRKEQMKPFDKSILTQYELEQYEGELLEECEAGGACPIR